MILDLQRVCNFYIGPYYCGRILTIADITIAPYFCRMCVIEHYRDFKVPEEIKNWHKWRENVIHHSAVSKTMFDNENTII